jgi:hypothetical protein
VLRKLGAIAAAGGSPQAARRYWEQARDCLEQLGADQAADEITALLAALNTTEASH